MAQKIASNRASFMILLVVWTFGAAARLRKSPRLLELTRAGRKSRGDEGARGVWKWVDRRKRLPCYFGLKRYAAIRRRRRIRPRAVTPQPISQYGAGSGMVPSLNSRYTSDGS